MSARTLPTTYKWPSLRGPVTSCLLEFNLLPSRTLHPQQAAELEPPEGMALARADAVAGLHRRWSARLLERLGESGAPVLNLAEPALPLALAAPPLMSRLARDLGIALLGNALRQVIDRQEVLAARAALGTESMAWALDGAARLHPGVQNSHSWLQTGWTDAAHAADQLGAGLLAQAWHDAPSPLRRRADWKLPLSGLNAECKAASGLTAPQARALCLKRLNQMEPTWLSFFH